MRFAKPSGVRGLGFLTCLSAVNAALILRVHQDRVNGTVGQSVLLPVSYTDPDPRGYLRIIWTRTAHVIIQHTRFSGKDGDHRSRTHITISDPYKHRAVLFPKNASLLLNDLQVNDSGIYELSIGLLRGMEKRSMTLTVWPDTTDGADTRNRNDTGNQNYIWNGSDTLDTTDTDKKQIPFEANARYVSLVVIFIFLCFTVKTCREQLCSRINRDEVFESTGRKERVIEFDDETTQDGGHTRIPKGLTEANEDPIGYIREPQTIS